MLTDPYYFSCAQKCTPRGLVLWLSQTPKWDGSTCSSLFSSSGLSCMFLMQHLFFTSHQGSLVVFMTFKRQEKASSHGHQFSLHTWIQPGWAYGLLWVEFSVIHNPILLLIRVLPCISCCPHRRYLRQSVLVWWFCLVSLLLHWWHYLCVSDIPIPSNYCPILTKCGRMYVLHISETGWKRESKINPHSWRTYITVNMTMVLVTRKSI